VEGRQVSHTFWHLQFTNKDVSGRTLEHNEQLWATFMNNTPDVKTKLQRMSRSLQGGGVGLSKRLDVCRGSVLCGDVVLISLQSSHWMVLMHMMLLRDQLWVKYCCSVCMSLWWASYFIGVHSTTDSHFIASTDKPIPWPSQHLDFWQLPHTEIQQLVKDEAHKLLAILLLYILYWTWLWSDCKLNFLPPYSPDYSTFEQAFLSIPLSQLVW
jgi:hypothetical protein